MSANRVQGWLAVAALVGFVSSAAPIGAEETAESGEQTTDPEADSSDVIVVACRFVRDDVLCEEVLVTGTQIRGADVTGLLPVSVLSGEDAELFGVDSGDELLELTARTRPELLQRRGEHQRRRELRTRRHGRLQPPQPRHRQYARAAERSPHGERGQLPNRACWRQLRACEHRQLKHHSVYGVDRVEVLKDGASAIYGADAVAGVVNNVLSVDYEGFRIRARYGWFDQVDRKPLNVDAAWGSTFNGGRTNLSVMGSFQSRDRINAQEDVRWSNSDFRRLIPEDSPWDGNTRFRNTASTPASASSMWCRAPAAPACATR